jgi:hypothetical protein
MENVGSVIANISAGNADEREKYNSEHGIVL